MKAQERTPAPSLPLFFYHKRPASLLYGLLAHLGGNEDSESARQEVGQHGGALLLAHVAVQPVTFLIHNIANYVTTSPVPMLRVFVFLCWGVG